MFDSVLTQENVPRGNLAGLGLSILFCGLLGTAAWLIPFKQGEKVIDAVDVLLFTSQPPPPPPPPPPAGSGAQTPSAEKPDITPKPKKTKKIVPTEPKPEVQKEPEPEPASEPAATQGEPGGVPGGVAGGVQGGVVGGVIGGVVGGTVGGTGVIPFGQGMTRPVQTSGSAASYTREATAARVEGKVIIRCTLTVEGVAKDCKVIKGVPMLDEIALASLRSARFTPVTFQGKPVAVQYTFPFNFKLP